MQIFVIAGASIIVLLGVAHAVFTLQSTPTGGPLTPTNEATQAAMQLRGGLGMAPGIDSSLWKAWVGFNLSHSVGVALGGMVLAVPAIADFEGALDNPWWVTMGLVLPAVYLLISLRYWFSAPTRGISLAALLIAFGIVGGLAT